MNISEKRLPQDGRINVRIKGEEIDIRVSTVPTVYGESVSLRLLTRGKIFLSLDKLGFSPAGRDGHPRNHRQAARHLPRHRPDRFRQIHVALRDVSSTINSVHKRIITVEEPVEYELKGINQIAVRPEIGLTFAMGLRHILRQDPNVIMVGEIRDLETAEIAIRAALTGHLVFSTLHTNDAPSAFTRLIDMGIEPFLVASSRRGDHGPTPRAHDLSALQDRAEGGTGLPAQRIGFPEEEIATAKFWHGAGCEECRQLGYQGRLGIYELLVRQRGVAPADSEPRRRLDHRRSAPLRTACARCGWTAGTRSGPASPPSRKSCA